jgi:anti-sigma B factor antagonist
MHPQFILTEERVDDHRHIVAVRGEIDLFTAPDLKAALATALDDGIYEIVVDLTETGFLDSTALGVLITTTERLNARDGRLTIVNVDASIAKTFEITGLDHVFTVRATRAEALAAFDDSEAKA